MKLATHTRTDLDRLDQLIDFYEQFKADGGPRTIQVRFKKKSLEKLAKPIEGPEDCWTYRNRTLANSEPRDK